MCVLLLGWLCFCYPMLGSVFLSVDTFGQWGQKLGMRIGFTFIFYFLNKESCPLHDSIYIYLFIYFSMLEIICGNGKSYEGRK